MSLVTAAAAADFFTNLCERGYGGVKVVMYDPLDEEAMRVADLNIRKGTPHEHGESHPFHDDVVLMVIEDE